MITAFISAEECAEVLRKVIKEELSIICLDDAKWCSWACGDFKYQIGDDIILTVFFDAGDFDYIDHIKFSDGRDADYDDWCKGPQPTDYLTGIERRQLIAILEQKIKEKTNSTKNI